MLTALGDSAIAQTLRSGLYPLARFVHLLGVALMVGSLIVLDLKVLCGTQVRNVRRLHAQVIPFVVTGLVLAVAAGITLFAVQPEALLENGALRIKLGLLAAGLLNAMWFERAWRRTRSIGVSTRTSAALSVFVWVLVVGVSTWIPYWQT